MSSYESAIKNRLKKEVNKLMKEPSDGIVCYPNDDSLSLLTAYLAGPQCTPYEGGTFTVELEIPDKYPFSPPNVRFKTKIYHPNIDEEGRVCMDVLKSSNWAPNWTLDKVLQSLRGLLMSPNANDPLVVEIAREYMTNIEKYKKTARDWTIAHAMARCVGPSGEGQKRV